jgi:hypothetical protein
VFVAGNAPEDDRAGDADVRVVENGPNVGDDRLAGKGR